MKYDKDVLLIIHDIYQDDNMFPLWAGYLGAILEENGYSVEVYCMDVYHYTNEDLADKLKNNAYKIIGVSFMAARFNETIRYLCKVINKYKKNAWLVLGGHGPSPIPEYTIKETKCDVVTVGEAEITILDILNDYERGTNKRIYYSKPIKKLDTLPTPAWHLFPMDIYTTNIRYKGMNSDDKALGIISSRGCINRCTFCYRMEKGIRLRSIKKLVEEMNHLNMEYGVTTFLFQDELFLISKKRLKRFRDEINKNNLKIKFSANARVDIFDDEMAEILKEIGCIHLNVGFESSSQEVLNHMKKNVTVEQNLKALKIIKKHKLPTGLNFIWGYPEDDRDTLMNNTNLIMEHNIYQQLRTIRPVTPYPGCELYYEAIDKGLITGPGEFFDKFKNSDLITINFTKYQDDKCYEWLLDANTILILDHYKNTNDDMDNAYKLINSFKNLYGGNITTFRGARHYDKKK